MSSKRKTIAWLAAAVAAIAVAMFAGRGLTERAKSKRVSGAPDEALREDIRELRSRLGEVEATSARRLALLDQQRGESRAAASSEAPAPARPADDVELAPAEPEPDEEEQRAELVAQLEGEFRSEAADPKWSRDAGVEATRALSQDMPLGSKLGTVECRTNMCRVETSHGNVQEYQAFVKSGLLSRTKKLWNAGFSSYVVEQSPSGITALTFIGRDAASGPEAPSVRN